MNADRRELNDDTYASIKQNHYHSGQSAVCARRGTRCDGPTTHSAPTRCRGRGSNALRGLGRRRSCGCHLSDAQTVAERLRHAQRAQGVGPHGGAGGAVGGAAASHF